MRLELADILQDLPREDDGLVRRQNDPDPRKVQYDAIVLGVADFDVGHGVSHFSGRNFIVNRSNQSRWARFSSSLHRLRTNSRTERLSSSSMIGCIHEWSIRSEWTACWMSGRCSWATYCPSFSTAYSNARAPICARTSSLMSIENRRPINGGSMDTLTSSS